MSQNATESGLFTSDRTHTLLMDLAMVQNAHKRGWLTEAKRNEMQERIYGLTDHHDPDVSLKAAALVEKMYQSDRKADAADLPRQHLHLHAVAPVNIEQRKQAIRDRITQQARIGTD